MKEYNPQKIEKSWQKYWIDNNCFKTNEDTNKPKYYVLDMFPYPSGAGLHVGHPKGYIATDIIARMKMMQGYNVLHPMGWDAFGLPAENYAIKNKVHPAKATEENIKTFKKQLALLGFTYDWDREVNTTDPQYYRWTQWIFLQMFKRGLAYESYAPINWCPSCQTGLANEDLEDGKCERCGSIVEQKPMRQWVLKITDYAERLLNDLDKLKDWPESIKEMQRNWIGRSEGATVKFQISNDNYIEVFTTRPDTLFGATYCVVAPENKMIKDQRSKITNIEEVEKYLEQSKNKTTLERTDLAKEKTGVEIKGIKAVNPVNGEELPIFVADYVLGNYGTGAIMAVPAHDERDFEFAKKYGLPTKVVVAPYIKLTGNSEPQDDKNTNQKKVVTVIIRNPRDNKYLLLCWKNGNCGFVGGSIEDGETKEETVLREVQEETGYKNFSIKKELIPALFGHGFKPHKDINCFNFDTVYFGDLLDEEKNEKDSHEVHDVFWCTFEEVEKQILLDHHRFMWKWYIENKECFSDDGISINSDFLNNLKTPEAKEKIITWLEEKGVGKRKVQYKLRDWVFSRQRYWGEPIPLVHCEKCGVVAIPEEELPLELPKVKNYEPTGTGESPLAGIDKWVNIKCPKCSGPAKRETNTMPQWAGSCWYYIAYCIPRVVESYKVHKVIKFEWNKEKIDYWLGAPKPGEGGVDFYVGGAEHATRHLIYARFWHKFLFDIGAVGCEEPFTRLQNVGLILAEDGRKMSKRWGNVINPDEVVKNFGADVMRVYEMFMGPFDQSCAWSTNGLVGAKRFLEKVWNLKEKVVMEEDKKSKITILLHQTIKKVTEDIGEMKFNTAISQMMILVNKFSEEEKISAEQYSIFIKLLSPFAPHICEELNQLLGNKESILKTEWPQYDPELIKDEEITIAVQINGKLRDTIVVPADISEEEVKKKVLESEKVQKWLENKEPKKVIYVKGKLVSVVV